MAIRKLLGQKLVYLSIVFFVGAGAAAAQSPASAADFVKQGIARAEKGDLNGAVADYTRAIELHSRAEAARKPNPSPGELKAAGGEIAVVDEFIALTFNNRGIAYYRNGERENALADFDRAVRMAPGLADAYNNRGNVFQSLGDSERALADFDRAIKINPRLSQAFNNRANIRMAEGDPETALIDYNRCLECDPANALAYANRGLTLLQLGRDKAAAADFNRAVKLNPALKSELETLIKSERKSNPPM